MYTILILAAVGLVSADVGLGYNYKVPQTSYGISSYQIGNSGDQKGAAANFNIHSSKDFAYQVGPQPAGGQNYQASSSFHSSNVNSQQPSTAVFGASSINNQYQQSSTANLVGSNLNSQYQQANAGNPLGSNLYQQGSVGNYGSNVNSQYQQSSAANLGSNLNSQYQQTNLQGSGINTQYQPSVANRFNAQSSSQYSGLGALANGGQQNYQYENRYQNNYEHKYQQQYFTQSQQPPQIFKHFYVHAAPEEPEQPKFRQPITLPPPQKHYKIIFIKTPSQPAVAPQYIPVPQQTDEKTIVYVLVQKPEEPENIELPKIEPKTPEKPEVFFIKYNNKDDSQAVINNIVTDYNNGQSVKFTAVNSGDAGSAGKYKESSGGAAAFVQTDSRFKETSFGTPGHTLALESKLEGANKGASYDETQEAIQDVLDLGSSGSNEVLGSHALSLSSVVGSGSGSVANLNADNAISTSQQVPHETYGVPKFRA